MKPKTNALQSLLHSLEMLRRSCIAYDAAKAVRPRRRKFNPNAKCT